MLLIKLALYYLLEVVEVIIIIRCIISWLPIGHNRFIEFLYTLTEPILAPIRNLLGRFGSGMMIDISPIIAFLLIGFVRRLIMML